MRKGDGFRGGMGEKVGREDPGISPLSCKEGEIDWDQEKRILDHDKIHSININTI